MEGIRGGRRGRSARARRERRDDGHEQAAAPRVHGGRSGEMEAHRPCRTQPRRRRAPSRTRAQGSQGKDEGRLDQRTPDERVAEEGDRPARKDRRVRGRSVQRIAREGGRSGVRRGRLALPTFREGGREGAEVRRRVPRTSLRRHVRLPQLPRRRVLSARDRVPLVRRPGDVVGRGAHPARRALPPLRTPRARRKKRGDEGASRIHRPRRGAPRGARADPRRERDRQGDRRAPDPHEVSAPKRAVLRLQLRERQPRAIGEPFLRTRKGGLHWRGPRGAGTIRACRRRDALPRRASCASEGRTRSRRTCA